MTSTISFIELKKHKQTLSRVLISHITVFLKLIITILFCYLYILINQLF